MEPNVGLARKGISVVVYYGWIEKIPWASIGFRKRARTVMAGTQVRQVERTARKKSRPVAELVVIIVVSIATFVAAVALEAFEKVFYWAQQYESYEVDEILTVGFILPIAFGIYAWRRWSDYKASLRETEDALARLDSALLEKDVLLKEVHHRTKNSLSIAASLIRISQRDSGGEVPLSEVASRIDSIAEVHRYLQESEAYDSVDLHDYLGRVVRSSLTNAPDVRIENDVAALSVPTKEAANLGLVLNEAATNAVKYGFNADEPKVFRIASEHDGSDLILTASNTGNPLPDGVTLNDPHTLGLQLVKMLVRQLGGTAMLKRTPQALMVIRIPNLASS
jgi:two-component sensor histidine kinase